MIAAAPSLFRTPKDSVHVWKISWAGWAGDIEKQAQAFLPEEEWQKARKYKIAEDRARYCAGRIGLRHLGGLYLGHEGKSLSIGQTDSGKPFFAAGASDLNFNISHSGSWVTIAFTTGHPVGIDVQLMEERDYAALARHSFHPEEIEAIEKTEGTGRALLFYRIWALKEAVIKAMDIGLGALKEFSVLPLPSGNFTPLACPAPGWPDKIFISELPFDERHAGALAVGGFYPAEIREFQWEQSGWREHTFS